MNLTVEELEYLIERSKPRSDGTHKHKCASCATIWEHSNNCADNEKAHTCPKCGQVQWYKYRGE